MNICPQCDKSFSKRKANQRFCTTACKQESEVNKTCKRCKEKSPWSKYALYCAECKVLVEEERGRLGTKKIAVGGITVDSCDKCPFLNHCRSIVWCGPARDGNPIVALPCESGGEVVYQDEKQLELFPNT